MVTRPFGFIKGAACSRDCTIHIFWPGIGHLPMLEAPAQVAEDYLAWRDSLGR